MSQATLGRGVTKGGGCAKRCLPPSFLETSPRTAQQHILLLLSTQASPLPLHHHPPPPPTLSLVLFPFLFRCRLLGRECRVELHHRCCTTGATRQVLHDRCCTTGRCAYRPCDNLESPVRVNTPPPPLPLPLPPAPAPAPPLARRDRGESLADL